MSDSGPRYGYRPRKGNPGFTLVEMMIVVGVMGLIMAILIPNYMHARSQSQGTICTGWLESISGAKTQAAFAHDLADSDTPADSMLAEFLQHSDIAQFDGSTDLCPAGGTYTVNAIHANPTCSLATVPGTHQME